jgi:hypothetical protein
LAPCSVDEKIQTTCIRFICNRQVGVRDKH